MMSLEGWMSYAEVAHYLGVDFSEVAELARSGSFSVHRDELLKRFLKRDEVERYKRFKPTSVHLNRIGLAELLATVVAMNHVKVKTFSLAGTSGEFFLLAGAPESYDDEAREHVFEVRDDEGRAWLAVHANLFGIIKGAA
jgi:hypothetical protein